MNESLTCVICEKQKPDVCWQVDPYAWEINDDEELRLLCNECYYELAMEI